MAKPSRILDARRASGQHGKSRLFEDFVKQNLVLTLRGRKYSEQNSLGFASGSRRHIPRKGFRYDFLINGP